MAAFSRTWAFLPVVVPQEVFPNAVAWGSSVFQGSQVVGPMVGGLVYGLSYPSLYASNPPQTVGSAPSHARSGHPL